MDSSPDQSQPLMQDNTPETPPTQTQYASYSPDMWHGPSDEKPHDSTTLVPRDGLPWTPIPMRTWFWVTYVCVLIAGAISLEVALYYSHKKGGWLIRPNENSIEEESQGFLHYVYTLPAVGVAMILASFWAWTDDEIKRLQPYVDLLHGDSPPQRSLLLDYTRSHNAVVWVKAASNRHYVVALSAIMALLSLSLQPLSAAVFNVRFVYETLPAINVNNLDVISLNPDHDLTSFVGASGFASASIVYGLGDPTFIYDGYTVSQFELPLPQWSYMAAITARANTTAILTNITCQGPDQLSIDPKGDGLIVLSAKYSDCVFSYPANISSIPNFGIVTITVTSGCGEPDHVAKDPSLAPVIFWYFTNDTVISASKCTPSITLQKVEVAVELFSSSVVYLRPLSNLTDGQSLFMQYAGNITGAPLYGGAYNGLGLTNRTNLDDVGRVDAIQQQLASAVLLHILGSGAGLTGVKNDTFASLTETVYKKYLSVLARRLYFINATEPIPVIASAFRKRFLLADVAVHILSGGMLLLALLGTISHLMHRRERRGLRLLHRPGTLASAGALIAQTPTGELLDGRQRPEEMDQALQNRKFRIDPSRMKIVTEDEPGYEYALSPVPSTLESCEKALPSIPSSGE